MLYTVLSAVGGAGAASVRLRHPLSVGSRKDLCA
jgi:hypothetical protein